MKFTDQNDLHQSGKSELAAAGKQPWLQLNLRISTSALPLRSKTGQNIFNTQQNSHSNMMFSVRVGMQSMLV